MEIAARRVDDDEVGFLGQEGLVARADGGVEDELLKSGCCEAGTGKKNRFLFGEIDLPEDCFE